MPRLSPTYDELLTEIASLRSRLSAAEQVVAAARKWDLKMYKVHEDSQYVWILANSHGMPYKGATYEKERENVRAALAAHDALKEGE